MERVVGFHNLALSINNSKLLDIPEFFLERGSCTVLSGANGSGKTTLMKIIAGLQRPDTCLVDWDRRTIQSWYKSRKLLHKHIVYLHQQPFLFDTTVYNNVAYGIRHMGLRRKEKAALIDEALDWVGLTGLSKRHARRLSGGEKQRLALARGFVLRPAVMLMDEPTANMDSHSLGKTLTLVQQLKESGISIMLSSHQLEHLDNIGDRHLHLCDCRIEAKTESEVLQSRPLRLIK